MRCEQLITLCVCVGVDAQDEDEDSKGRLQWRMVEMRVVRYATLPRLIEAFGNDEGEVDSTYVCIFLVTFRSFCTAREVLEEIIKRYGFSYVYYC
jgi:hypothetical protein